MSIKEKIPLQESATVSIAANGTDSAIITVPEYETWFIKSWTITKGADVTVNSINIDGNDTYETTNQSDTVTRYGALLTSDTEVTINGSNASGLGAQNLEIQVDGYKVY